MTEFNFHTVAIVHSCYKEKFGIPRQSGLSLSAEATIELIPPYNQEDYVRELEGFSHIWVVFIFHQHLNIEAKATVRPPRLGGNKRIGVFASRSPFRPNPVGLSAVKLNKVTVENKKVILHVSGADFIDNTPVIDIKPYINYADSIPDAQSSYANTAPANVLNIIFLEAANRAINDNLTDYPDLKNLIHETISLDPRPAYINDTNKEYGLNLYDFNIRWRVKENIAEILAIES